MAFFAPLLAPLTPILGASYSAVAAGLGYASTGVAASCTAMSGVGAATIAATTSTTTTVGASLATLLASTTAMGASATAGLTAAVVGVAAQPVLGAIAGVSAVGPAAGGVFATLQGAGIVLSGLQSYLMVPVLFSPTAAITGAAGYLGYLGYTTLSK